MGFGTKLGNGCTSGHGVCGLPRFSIRSLVAVMTFMGAGILTATARNLHPFLNEPSTKNLISSQNYELNVNIVLGVAVFVLLIVLATSPSTKELTFILVSLVVGLIAGTGLVLSGMVRRSKVVNFLTIKENWDPSLMFVMMGAVLGNLFTFNFIIRVLKKPLLAPSLDIVNSTVIDWKLCLGAAIFGVGWGLGGMCPGPVVLSVPLMFPQISWIVLPAIGFGQLFADFIVKNISSKAKAN